MEEKKEARKILECEVILMNDNVNPVIASVFDSFMIGISYPEKKKKEEEEREDEPLRRMQETL